MVDRIPNPNPPTPPSYPTPAQDKTSGYVKYAVLGLLALAAVVVLFSLVF